MRPDTNGPWRKSLKNADRENDDYTPAARRRGSRPRSGPQELARTETDLLPRA